MKILVAYYSRTGSTRKVAEKIAKKFKADIDKIIDKKSRKGIFGWIIACFDALREKLTRIEFEKNPNKYDLVILGTPVWAEKITPAVRTYILKNKIKKIAFFSTSGSGKEPKGIKKFNPCCILTLKGKNLDENKINGFCNKIR